MSSPIIVIPPPAEGGGDAGCSIVGIGPESPAAAGVSPPLATPLSSALILLWRELICDWSCETVPCKSVIASVSLVVMMLTTSPSWRIFCSLGSWRAHSNSSRIESSSSFFSLDIYYDSSTTTILLGSAINIVCIRRITHLLRNCLNHHILRSLHDVSNNFLCRSFTGYSNHRFCP